jgi:hypothetical protein
VYAYTWHKRTSLHWMFCLAAVQDLACSGRFGIFLSHNLFVETLPARNNLAEIARGVGKQQGASKT